MLVVRYYFCKCYYANITTAGEVVGWRVICWFGLGRRFGKWHRYRQIQKAKLKIPKISKISLNHRSVTIFHLDILWEMAWNRTGLNHQTIKRSKDRAENIVLYLPVVKDYARNDKSPLKCFQLFFYSDVIEHKYKLLYINKIKENFQYKPIFGFADNGWSHKRFALEFYFFMGTRWIRHRNFSANTIL